MERLEQDIKNHSFKRVYLLYGEERYLLRNYRDWLIKTIRPNEDDMNFHYFEEKKIEYGKIVDLAETLPFMSEYRLIVIENSDLFKDAQQSEAMIVDYISQIPEFTIIIFVEKNVKENLKVYKLVNKCGMCVNFAKKDEKYLKKWVTQILGREGKKIRVNTIDFLLERCGNEMQFLMQELDKLIAYSKDEVEITIADIESITCVRVEENIYNLINCIGAKRQQDAIGIYYDLLQLKIAPIYILSQITSKFNDLYQVKLLMNKGYNKDRISGVTGLSSGRVYHMMNGARAFDEKQLRNSFEECISVQEKIKIGLLSEIIAVEMLIIKYSS